MEKKLLAIFVCMLVIASTTILISPDDLQVKAAGEENYGSGANRLEINTTYIHSVTQELSNIVDTFDRGRSFGTEGELYASARIEDWMNEIGLYDTHTDEIKGTAQHPNLNATLEIVSKGILINGTQSITDCYITPRWNTTFISLLDPDLAENKSHLTYNFSYTDPLPIYQKPNFSAFDELFNDLEFLDYLAENLSLRKLDTKLSWIIFFMNQLERIFNFTYENIDISDPDTLPSWYDGNITEPKCSPYLLIEEDPSYNPNATIPSVLLEEFEPLSAPRAIYHALKLIIEMSFWNLTHHNCMGLIRYDFNNDTYDMTNGLLNARPILYINGSVGRPIYENATLITPSNREISFWINQSYNPSIKSYNVFGQINGTNPNKTVLIDCLYDCWWNQGTSDSAIGMGTVLALAKYFKDNNITLKYNLKFVAFGGEEYGFLGAQHYNDTHTNENITTVIDLNQIGFSQTGPLPQTMFVHTNNESLKSLLRCITNDTHYEERTGTPFLHIGYTYYGGPSDDQPFAIACLPHKGNRSLNTICFLKDMNWTMHHRDGQNHEKGDVMTYYNETDVNVTSEMIWNITKYFCVNPNCGFDNVVFTKFDSPNDGDTLPDSIRVNFSIDSILPNDKVMVNASLCDQNNNPVLWTINNYTITTLTGVHQNLTYTFSLPVTIDQGFYKMQLLLYNSTGRINKIVNSSDNVPDEIQYSDSYYLYHPFGYPMPGELYSNTEDVIRGSYFTANEYGTARNITAYIQAGNTSGPPSIHSVCMIYRKNDNKLIGRTEDTNPVTGANPAWVVYNFSEPYPILEEDTEYVLVCWSEASCYLYYDHMMLMSRGRYNDTVYGSSPDPIVWDGANNNLYSIYCGYRNDTNPPWVTNVTEDPHIVGFGGNVTISADVVDNESGVKNVTVIICYPGGKSENKTMSLVSNNTYRYVFDSTWLVGRYNYSIWAIDNYDNMINVSIRSHFHVSADASISIATLQDSYSGSQYINITDPPNPPENYTLVDRGLTWDKYYDAITGQNILEVSAGPINYQDNGTWIPINNTVNLLAENHPAFVYGYRSGNNRGLYGVYFKSNAQLEWPVAFTYNRSDDPTVHVIRSKLVDVGYVDSQSNWAYQYLQNVQNSQGQINENSITYSGVFTGTDVTWRYGNTGLKEEITLSNATKTVLQNHPPSQYGLNDTSSYLVFITKLDYQNLNLYNKSGLLDENITISDTGIEFKDVLGQFKCSLPLGEAYELNNQSIRQKLTYRIVHLNGATYLLSGLKLSDLNAMTFPVVIDPTLSVNSLYSDGYLSSSSTSYNTTWNASSGTVDSSGTYLSIGQKKVLSFPTSTYYVYRGFALFNTSALPSNSFLDNATLSLYKKDDYSTTDFDITIQNGQPTYPHNPLQTGDYAKSHYSANGGSLNTANFVNGRNNISVTNLEWVNKSGITKLCLRSSRDINGTTSTGNEYVNVYSANAPNAGWVPKLIIAYRNQSKIKNTGSTDIKGYLLIQVQFYNTSQVKWLVDNDTINETKARIITSGNQLALDTICSGHVRASDLTHGIGTYRVYAAFRDPERNILRTNDDVDLEAWWQFSKT
ncbi:MAG TPA: M28 family peptidase [Candidatus Thermoplasmatota archaeon]|nr:M28 family peptidase [Candidatus Thermoplasmatota archaeon]